MQSLLTPVRYVINPRFNLTLPAQSGLFFLAPGIGYMVGCFIGGPLADRTARYWKEKRGFRIPEDRLRSSFIAMGIFITGSIAIYGWSIDQIKGGIPLPVICMFVQGVATMICLPCLNTYCMEVLEKRGSEVMGKSNALPCISLQVIDRTLVSGESMCTIRVGCSGDCCMSTRP